MNENELKNWQSICSEEGKGCILEVDFQYPKKLHDQHNEYPLAPERLRPEGSKVDKLIPNLKDKERYVIHYKN